ncbi:MAG: 9-O-acetylesterase [Sphingobacteriales bacterium]|mgnify:FL=1|nr:9-O-acetylesterase [Sphingobacteriales bacterium]
MRMIAYKKMILVLLVLHLQHMLQAQLQLPDIFGDSMVLQRQMPIRIWGKASPGQSIRVGLHDQEKTARADAGGEWSLALDPEEAGGPYTLIVTADREIRLRGILIGDIWLCSGQSNMEFPVRGWSAVVNADEELANAHHPAIRLFTVQKKVGALPEYNTGGSWQSSSAESVAPFSAIGYFFGLALQQDLNVPIGLINATWGGTQIEAWISRNGLEQDAYYRSLVKAAPARTMEGLLQTRKQKQHQSLGRLQKQLTDVTDSVLWKNADYADKKWMTMVLPGFWEKEPALRRLDGIVWFRKRLWVRPEDAGKEARIRIGKIDDNDITYFNGTQVGATRGWDVDRMYTIPPTLLKAGENVIAVRVEDGGNGGGIYGDSSELYLTAGNSRYTLAGSWSYRIQQVMYSNNAIGPNDYPSLLYNGMIHPAERLSVKGVIWYQGEQNASRAYEYRKALPVLIQDWRRKFGQPQLPFYFVQLTSFNAANGNSKLGSTWAEMRESQAAALSLSNTGMVVSIDLGDAHDIHPRRKKEVAQRLAALALQQTYGRKVEAGGPRYLSMSPASNSIRLHFSSDNGLAIRPAASSLQGFEIAGVDQLFYPATAVIDGNSILVSAAEVRKPVAVRYAWADDAGNANLIDRNGWPAAPFRTDRWPAITQKEKYNPFQNW